MNLEDKKRAVFKQHPNEKQFHFTSDATAFYNESDAKVYANTLEDNSVELVKRSDVLKVVSSKSEVESTGEVESKKSKVESTDKGESKKAKVEGTGGDDERTGLFAKLEALGGKAPKNIGLEKLKEKVAELEKVESGKQKEESPEGDK
ncbi:hypothetical protein [Pedobacter arcticus]|uniref:hypothetical protein n=1 Tax=Pedobacter arcticus TaxID=752140 RepID=UPI000318D3C2|nr:hypothetical protein [Pedobacter arcticus]